MAIHLPTQFCRFIYAAIILSGLPAAALAAEPMPTFSVSYIAENDFITGGKAEFRLEKNQDHYQLVLETKPTGMFRLSKKGKIKEVATLPSLSPPFLSDAYSYTNFGDQDRSYASTYNRNNGIATIVADDGTKQSPMNPTDVDRVSMTLALMHRLRDQPDMENFSINIIDAKGTEKITYAAKGQYSLKTKVGDLTATRVDRQRSGSDRITITWFANLGPANTPLPVQIEQYKRGKLSVRLKITDFSISN